MGALAERTRGRWSGPVALVACFSLSLSAMYLHVMQDAQFEVVHASLLHLRTELRSLSEQLELARRVNSPAASSSSAVPPATGAYPGRVASARVHALRAANPNPQPMPPLQVNDVATERARKQNNYGGGADDAAHIGGWMVNDTNGWEPHLWTFLSEVEHISTFLDVGCGAGLVTKFMLDRGVDARCIEASNEAIRNSLVPRDRIVQHDYTRGPWWPRQLVDVAYTVEFLEHVDIQYLDNVMATLKSARYVIMAASKHGGWSHVNVHYKWWWIERMEAYGFEYSPRLSEYVLDNLIIKLSRPYAYLKYTGLIFRNPEVDFENAFKESGHLPERKETYAKHKHFLQHCGCY